MGARGTIRIRKTVVYESSSYALDLMVLLDIGSCRRSQEHAFRSVL